MTTTSALVAEGALHVQPASGAFSLTWLLIGFPVLGTVVLMVVGRRTNRWGAYFGAAMSWASFVIAAILFVTMLGRDSGERAIGQHLFSWVPAGSFQVDAGLLLDPLSLAFVLLITFVGSLIHVYSIAYMADDPDRRLFFSYLNLFVAAML
ncbi:MAG TPA: NADH-quinone oxidoreductase subunit L, partial [Actinomycetales bacterium]|nr:NADH-quinone oxidoreductase subunit L [Actinomycetales bacterium]